MANADSPLPPVDIVVPVYNEGANIISMMESFRRELCFPYRVLVCYDREEDETLRVLAELDPEGYRYELVRNYRRGVLGAIQAGFARSTAPWVITFPADDDYTAPRLNRMVELAVEGADVVCASRLMRGGCMEGCWWVKAVLVRVAGFFLHRMAGLPTHDASNGLRLFSRRVIDELPIESGQGWAFSLEKLVKVHRLGWRIAEVPAEWHERKAGQSRFRVFGWLPEYLRWFLYAFDTTWGGRGPASVGRVPGHARTACDGGSAFKHPVCVDSRVKEMSR
jgi:dolichol-phosphate mannosyltransferase